MRVLLLFDNAMNVELFVDSLAVDGREVVIVGDVAGLTAREKTGTCGSTSELFGGALFSEPGRERR